MGLDFVAIDFETAGPKRASVCQIGLAKVRDEQITKTACEMVRPQRGFTDFHPRNIQVHGLTPKSIYGAPSWPGILDRLVTFTGDLPLVGHNVAFERSVIVQASEAEGLTAPKLPIPVFTEARADAPAGGPLVQAEHARRASGPDRVQPP
jgi:DNA polymerase-3 subunit epsilon